MQGEDGPECEGQATLCWTATRTSGPRGADSATSVQFVPDGNSNNISLGLVRPSDYSPDIPTLVTSCYVFGSNTGPNANDPVIVAVSNAL